MNIISGLNHIRIPSILLIASLLCAVAIILLATTYDSSTFQYVKVVL